MENRRLLGEDLEGAQFFTLSLDDVNCLAGAVDHHKARLEADQLAEGERARQESHHRDKFKHGLGTTRFIPSVFDLNRLLLKLREVEHNKILQPSDVPPALPERPSPFLCQEGD